MTNDCINQIELIANHVNKVNKELGNLFLKSLNSWLTAQIKYMAGTLQDNDLEQSRIEYESNISKVQFNEPRDRTKFLKLLADFEKLTLALLMVKMNEK